MCKMSESISEIAKALVAFHGEVKRIEKDGTNPHFKSDYATLDNIIDETSPLLFKHGLTVMQFPGGDGERITVRTIILHRSGEWIESDPLTLRPTKIDPQGAGSAITYARRYSYAAALSLPLGDDDDGNAASVPQRTVQTPPRNRSTDITDDDLNALEQDSEANRAQPTRSQQTSNSAASRVYKLREQKGMTWQDLNEFAAQVLGREIKYLKAHVKGEEEWLMIERALRGDAA